MFLSVTQGRDQGQWAQMKAQEIPQKPYFFHWENHWVLKQDAQRSCRVFAFGDIKKLTGDSSGATLSNWIWTGGSVPASSKHAVTPWKLFVAKETEKEKKERKEKRKRERE